MVEKVNAVGRCGARLRPALRLAMVLLGLSAAPRMLNAHRVDECLQAALLGIRPDRVELDLELTPGAAVAPLFLKEMDADQDGEISRAEGRAYAAKALSAVRLELDDTPLRLKLSDCEAPRVAEVRVGQGVLRLHAVAVVRHLSPGAHHLRFANHFRGEVSAYLVNALRPESADLAIQAQARDERQTESRIDFTYQPGSPAKAPARPPG